MILTEDVIKIGMLITKFYKTKKCIYKKQILENCKFTLMVFYKKE